MLTTERSHWSAFETGVVLGLRFFGARRDARVGIQGQRFFLDTGLSAVEYGLCVFTWFVTLANGVRGMFVLFCDELLS